MSATLIEYTAVARMVEDARTGAWDIAVVAFDPARRAVVDFAPLYIRLCSGLGPSLRWGDGLWVAPGSGITSVAEADQPGVKCVGWVKPII